jgi:AcrR family transcriptional regulator
MDTARPSNATTRAILEAALALLAESGFHGATTRAIALRAGVNEVTLFRRFGSKEALLRAAVHHMGLAVAVPPPSDDVAQDLHHLIASFREAIGAGGERVLRILPECVRHPELTSDGPPQGMSALIADVIGLFSIHQRAGRLWDREPPEAMVLAFVGPLVAQLLVGGVVGVHLPVIEDAYVAAFLGGRGRTASRPLSGT